MKKDHILFEELEMRSMLSASVKTIGETSGVTAAAAGKNAGTLALGPTVVYFNGVKASSSTSTDGGTSTYDLRVYNTSTTARLIIPAGGVTIGGTDAADFKVTAYNYNPTVGISMIPGKQFHMTIQFTADSTVGTKTAYIQFKTTDPKHPVVQWPLRGLVTNGNNGATEPSLQTVFNFFQLGGSTGINAGEQSGSNAYYVASGSTDAVDVQTFVKAGTGNVSITPLAEFTNSADPTVRMGFYTPGVLNSEKYIWYSPAGTNESVAPLAYGQTAFDPGTAAFGLVTQYPYFTNSGSTVTTANNLVRNVYSENQLNKTWDNSTYVHMKVYPYIDQNGTAVPNAYIVAEEEYSDDSVADNQDLVYVVTNVKPSGIDQPTASYQNLMGYPSNDTMSFNVVQNVDTNVGNDVHNFNTLRLRDSGTEPLIYSTSITGDFSIVSGGGTNVSIAAGNSTTAFKDIKVQFTASSGAGIHEGFLTITTNDPTQPTIQIALHGFWQEYSEQTPTSPHVPLEPSAQTVVNDLLGYESGIPSDSTLRNSNGTTALLGSEINAPYFTTADTGAPVEVVELASWHSESYTNANTPTPTPTSSFLSWYTEGNSTTFNATNLRDKANQGQSVLPTSNTGSAIASGTFRPAGTTKFGFSVENIDFSDPTLNVGGKKTFRFYPAIDENGVPIPNAYIAIHDYDNSATNDDYNDEIYLISNVIPVGQMKPPRTVYAQPESTGNLINYTSPDDGPKVYGFNVYRSTTATGTFTLLNTAGLLARRPSGTYIDTSATPGTTYYYEVTTVGNGGVESDPYMVKVN